MIDLRQEDKLFSLSSRSAFGLLFFTSLLRFAVSGEEKRLAYRDLSLCLLFHPSNSIWLAFLRNRKLKHQTILIYMIKHKS